MKLMDRLRRSIAARALGRSELDVTVDDDGCWAVASGQRWGYHLARRRWIVRSPPLLARGVTRLLTPDGADAVGDAELKAALLAFTAKTPTLSLGFEAGAVVVELLHESVFGAPAGARVCARLSELVPVLLKKQTLFAPQRLCPTGDDGVLKNDGEVWRCPACAGAVLSPSLVLDHVLGPRGLGPGDLKENAGRGGRAQDCPLCSTAMAPVLIDDDIIDFCRGCGAMFVDDGEAEALTGGHLR